MPCSKAPPKDVLSTSISARPYYPERNLEVTRIDPKILQNELGKTLNSIELLVQQVEVQAKEQSIEPYEVRDSAGRLALVQLTVAKAQTLHALTIINEEKGN